MPEGRKYGSREDILDSADHLTEDVFVPEFGERWYRIRGLSGTERERYENSLGVYSKNGKVYAQAKGSALARLVAMSVVDDTDKQLFSEEDIGKLARKNAAGLSRVADVCRRLSGLSEADMEELEGNFGSDQSDSSTSSSRSLSVAPSPSSSPASPATS